MGVSADRTFERPREARQQRPAGAASAKGRGLHDATAPIRMHPCVNAAGLRADVARDPGLDCGFGPDIVPFDLHRGMKAEAAAVGAQGLARLRSDGLIRSMIPGGPTSPGVAP
jgi:hypothetical protein